MVNFLNFAYSSQNTEQNKSNNTGPTYFQSVITFLGKIKKLGSECSEKEFDRAEQIKAIHNVIEEVAYRAFAEKVVQLGISQNVLTEEESGKILAHIKMKAHQEMYKKEGSYISERVKLLDSSQITEVMKNVGKIVHDRDTKLTDARYYTLSELLMGLDDHNTMVKEILVQSWYKCPKFSDSDHEHLEQIKENVSFYATLDKQLKFDLKESLKKCKMLWNEYFPGKREASEKTSKEFMNIQAVRHFFGELKQVPCEASDGLCSLQFVTPNQAYTLKKVNLDVPLVTYLETADIKACFEQRILHNRVRCANQLGDALLEDKSLTMRQFLLRYFPERGIVHSSKNFV